MNKKSYGCTDCFAYGEKSCAILTTKLCITRKCGFYKTHQQFVNDLDKYPKIDYKLLYEERHKYEKTR